MATNKKTTRKTGKQPENSKTETTIKIDASSDTSKAATQRKVLNRIEDIGSAFGQDIFPELRFEVWRMNDQGEYKIFEGNIDYPFTPQDMSKKYGAGKFIVRIKQFTNLNHPDKRKHNLFVERPSVEVEIGETFAKDNRAELIPPVEISDKVLEQVIGGIMSNYGVALESIKTSSKNLIEVMQEAHKKSMAESQKFSADTLAMVTTFAENLAKAKDDANPVNMIKAAAGTFMPALIPFIELYIELKNDGRGRDFSAQAMEMLGEVAEPLLFQVFGLEQKKIGDGESSEDAIGEVVSRENA